MTLFLAVAIGYGFDFPDGYFVAATLVWLGHLVFHNQI